MKLHAAPSGSFASEIVVERTTTGLLPYGQASKERTVSKVLRPITIASTLAMNSSYPWGSASAGSQSSAPSGRAMKPSMLVAMKTDSFI